MAPASLGPYYEAGFEDGVIHGIHIVRKKRSSALAAAAAFLKVKGSSPIRARRPPRQGAREAPRGDLR
jgi:hypothetical protein